MPTQADIAHDYRRLKILLESTDSFVLTFALYRDAKEQRENAKKLREMLELPVTQVALKGDNLNPVKTFLSLPKEPRQAIFFTFLGSSLPEGGSDFDKFAGYVNIQREAFTDAPHAVVLWLREEQLVRLMRRAPDFWAWRSGVFDFRGELTEDFVAQRDLEFNYGSERAPLEEQVVLYRDILKSQLQRDNPDLAYVVRTRLRLSGALYKLGLYKEMASEAYKAFLIAETLGDETDMASASNNLAVAYNSLGRSEEAEFFYRKTVTLSGSNAIRRVEHINYLANLAELLTEMGRYAEAESLFEEALKLAEQTVGKNHPSYARSLGQFSTLLSSMHRYDEAEPLYKKALDITANTLGKESVTYVNDIGNLATLLTKKGSYDEAESLFKEALERIKETVGKEHPNYSLGLQSLACLFAMTGRYDEAETLFKKALEGYREHWGEESPRTKRVEANYQLLQQERSDAERDVGETT